MAENMQEELRKAAEHMQRMSQAQQQESAWRSTDETVSLLDLKDDAQIAVGGADKYAAVQFGGVVHTAGSDNAHDEYAAWAMNQRLNALTS